jgi:hydrogenase maturation protease
MTRVFCCGNRNRGDDAAALLVAERLQRCGIDAEIYEDDPLAIMDRWDGADDVIIVDAMASGAAIGTVQVWELPTLGNFAGANASTHGLGVAEAIRLAEVLGRLPWRLRVYGIEGMQFEPGTDVRPEVQQAVERVARQIADELTPVASADRPH